MKSIIIRTPSILGRSSLLGAAVLLLGLPATAGTMLDEGMNPFHMNRGNTGVAEAVGSFSIFTGEGRGAGSGTVLDLGAKGTWVLTAAHVLAGVGESDEGIPAFTDFFMSGNYYTTVPDPNGGQEQPIDVLDWYVPDTYDGTVVSRSDIALARLDMPVGDDNFGVGVSADTPDRGDPFNVVGFGRTGTGASGALIFDGNRRSGRNRADLPGRFEENIIRSDFDVDPDDALYDPFMEFGYLDSSEEFQLLLDDPDFSLRGNGTADFRTHHEYAVGPGDSGGGVFFGDVVGAVTSFGEIAPVTGIHGFFTFQQGFVLTAPWVEWIDSVIATVDAEADLDLVSAQVAGVGSGVGAVKGSPFSEAIVSVDETGDLSAQFNALVMDYYQGDALSLTEQAALTGAVSPLSADLSNSEIAAILGLVDSSQVEALLDETLYKLYGASLAELAQLEGFEDMDPQLMARHVPLITNLLGEVGPDGRAGTPDVTGFPVPEPASAALVALGAGFLLMRRRRG